MTCTGWKDAAFRKPCSSSLKLEVSTFQYQASILTSAALRKYLPLQSKPALSRGLSRIFRGTFAKNHPRFRAESHRLNTHRHTYTGWGHEPAKQGIKL